MAYPQITQRFAELNHFTIGFPQAFTTFMMERGEYYKEQFSHESATDTYERHQELHSIDELPFFFTIKAGAIYQSITLSNFGDVHTMDFSFPSVSGGKDAISENHRTATSRYMVPADFPMSRFYSFDENIQILQKLSNDTHFYLLKEDYRYFQHLHPAFYPIGQQPDIQIPQHDYAFQVILDNADNYKKLYVEMAKKIHMWTSLICSNKRDGAMMDEFGNFFSLLNESRTLERLLCERINHPRKNLLPEVYNIHSAGLSGIAYDYQDFLSKMKG